MILTVGSSLLLPRCWTGRIALGSADQSAAGSSNANQPFQTDDDDELIVLDQTRDDLLYDVLLFHTVKVLIKPP